MMDKRKWKGRTGGSFWGQQSLLAIFKIFDVRAGYVVMAVLVPFYMLFNHRAYRAIYNYFRRGFGYSRQKAFVMSYLNHFTFGQVILDRFAVFSGHKDFFEAEIVGVEHFNRLIEGEKGFILAGSHIGNLEIGGYLLRQERKRINALVYPDETRTVQRNRSRVLEGNNIRLIPVDGDMSHIFAIHSAIRSGEIVSMPCDRNWGSSKSVRCRFMHGYAGFPVGAFALASALDVEVLSIFVLKSSYRKYIVYVKPIRIEGCCARDRQGVTEEYVRAFAGEMERILRLYPLQWFNYYDFFDEEG